MESITLKLVPVGIIAIEDNHVVDSYLFGDTPEKCIESYLDIANKKLSKNIKKFIKSFTNVHLNTSSISLFELIRDNILEIKCEFNRSTPPYWYDPEFAKGIGYESEYLQNLMRECCIELTSSKLKESLQNREILLIQAVNSLEESFEISNKIYERLREWYNIHFPELESIIQNINTYTKIIQIGKKTDLTEDKLLELGIDKKKSIKIIKKIDKSIGASISDQEISILKKLAFDLENILITQKNLEKYIEQKLPILAPNFTYLIKPRLAGIFLSKVGGLGKIAIMAASNIQLIGAEKALFRALKTGARPPKHGIIFQHPDVNKAPKKIRGKIARTLASKILTAVRIDVYGGEFKGDKLLEELNHKINEIKIKHDTKMSKIKTFNIKR